MNKKKIFKMLVDVDKTSYITISEESFKKLSKKERYSTCKLDKLFFDVDDNIKLTDAFCEGTLSLEGLPISEKLYQILNKFNLHDIQFIDIKASNLRNYKFMFFNGDLTTKIDYEKSNFKIIEDTILTKQVLDYHIYPNRKAVINAYKEYCISNIFNKLTPINGYKFKHDFDVFKYDIFRIGYFDLSFYVSQRVKLAVEKNNITGLCFVETELFEENYKYEIT